MEKIDFSKQKPTKRDNGREFLCVVKGNNRSEYELANWTDETDIYPNDEPYFSIQYYQGLERRVAHYYRLENI